MKVLETDRLIIRGFTLDDVEDIHRILDLELKWAGEPRPIEERRQIIQSHIMGYDSYPPLAFGYRAVVLKETGKVIGMIKFAPGLLDPEPRRLLFGECEQSYNSLEMFLGYAFSAAYEGKGYATEAARAMIEHAFKDLKIDRLFADTSESNIRSLSLMERVGMRTVKCPRPGWENRVVAVLENNRH